MRCESANSFHPFGGMCRPSVPRNILLVSVKTEVGPGANEQAGAQTRAGAGDGPPRPSQPPVRLSRGRRILINSLIGIATLLLVVGIFAVWSNRLLFNPTNWSNTSTQLLSSPNVRAVTANYAVDQLYTNVNVPALIKSALPSRLDPLASPVAGALRNVAVQGVETALGGPRVQALWAQANRAADQAFIAIVNGGKGAVGVNGGVVTLDLASVVDNVAARLGLPANLGAKLPPDVANLTIIKSNQLGFVQDIGKALRHLALLLTILVPILYAGAIALAGGRRRRTLMSVGSAIVVGGLIVLVARRIFDGQIIDQIVKNAALRPAVTDTVLIGTEMIRQIAIACVYVGVPLILAAWFAGPARAATAARRTIAPFLRQQPAAAYGITLGVMALIFIWDPIYATGTAAGILVFTALALLGMFVLRRQTESEFPVTQPDGAIA